MQTYFIRSEVGIGAETAGQIRRSARLVQMPPATQRRRSEHGGKGGNTPGRIRRADRETTGRCVPASVGRA